MAKQGWTFEAFYGDQWRSLQVRTAQGHSIARGLRNEAGSLTPQTASFILDGRDDPWNPFDPESALYDQVGRNFPVRIGHEPGYASGVMADASDDFSGTSAAGWPDADVGGAWSRIGAGGTVNTSDWTEGGGVGSIYVPVTNAYRLSYLGGLTGIEDATIAETWTCPQATGADLEPSDIVFRGSIIPTEYMTARTAVNTSNAVTLSVFDKNGTLLGSYVTGLTHAGAGTPLRTKVRYAGRDVWVKVWDPAGAEPDWQLHVTDTHVPVSGWVGVRSGRASGNTNSSNPQFTHDDFAVTVNTPRFVGEVAALRPRRTIDWDGTRGDRWAEVEAAGVLRRLAIPDNTLRGTLYRYLSRSSDVVAYWPLEESSGAQTVAEVAADGRPGSVTGEPAFGTDSGTLTGAESVVQMDSGDFIHLTVPRATPSGGWAAYWALQVPSAPGSDLEYLEIRTTGTAATWVMRAGTAGMATEVYSSTGTSLDSASTLYGTGAEPPQWLLMRLQAEQNGGNIDWSLLWNVVGTSTFYWTGVQSFAGSVGRPVSARIGGSFTFNFGSLVMSGGSAIGSGLLAQLATGYAGELVEERLARLFSEEGVFFDYVGAAGDTPAMSGQEPKTLPDLYAEAADADGGIPSEAHGWLGVRLRGLRDLYNQAAALTLDATTGSIASGSLDPDVDDLPTENDVTARRPGGSEARAVLEAGRMSVQDPPTGAGRTAKQHDVALYVDGDLPSWAYWRLHLGTINEGRYPRITVDLDAAPSLAVAATQAQIGDIIAIDNLGNLGTVRLLVLGIEETGNSHRRMITYNCMPGSAFNIFEYNSNTYGMYDSDGSTLAADFDAGTDTSMSVAVSNGYLWVAGAVSLNVRVGGNVVSVSNISGSSSPQTFTVSATLVSGVAKTVPAGSEVHVANQSSWGR